MRVLDLFCCAGGASKGLADAGFEVVGIDKDPQPDYPFSFVQADALQMLRQWDRLLHPMPYALIWASPPCQRYSTMTHKTGAPEEHPDLIAATRQLLVETGVPYVIENVPGARRALRDPIMLCGTMFGLGVVRHRYFECSFPVHPPPHRKHRGSIVTGEFVTVTGNGGVPAWTLKERERRGLPRHIPGEMSLARWQEAMGIDWMPRRKLTQAIPPAYAEYLGRAFLAWHELSS